jgi:hypothetical protein
MNALRRALMSESAIELDENPLLDVGDVVALRPSRYWSVLPLTSGQSMRSLDVSEIAQFHRALRATRHVAENVQQEMAPRMPGSRCQLGQDHRLWRPLTLERSTEEREQLVDCGGLTDIQDGVLDGGHPRPPQLVDAVIQMAAPSHDGSAWRTDGEVPRYEQLERPRRCGQQTPDEGRRPMRPRGIRTAGQMGS